MSLSSVINRISYSGNGATLAFSFPYYFLADEDLVVISRDTASGVETTKVLTTDYTVTGEGSPSGGTVTMLVAPATGTTLTIYRDPEQTQDLNLVENDPLPAEELEERFDKGIMIDQRLSDRMDRAVRLSDGTAAAIDLELPTPSAGLALGWNATEDGLTNLASAGDLAVSSYIETLLDDANAAAARTTLELQGVTSLTTKGDLLSFSTVAARVSVGLNGQKLVADSTATPGIKWAHNSTAAKTTTYSITTADDILTGDTDAGAFTMTLPDCATSAGKIFRIKKVGTSYATANALTISKAGSDTIFDTVSLGNTTTLNTPGEEIEIASFGGTVWHILNRRIPPIMKAFTPVTSWVSNATATGFMQRIGDCARIKVQVACTGVPTSAALTADLPTGLTIDTAKLLSTGVHETLGVGKVNDSSSAIYAIVVRYQSTTQIVLICLGASGTYVNEPGAVSQISGAPISFDNGDFVNFEYTVPIVGWNG